MDYKESVRAGPEEKNLVLTVHRSDQCGNAQNCKYPYSGIGSTPEELNKQRLSAPFTGCALRGCPPMPLQDA